MPNLASVLGQYFRAISGHQKLAVTVKEAIQGALRRYEDNFLLTMWDVKEVKYSQSGKAVTNFLLTMWDVKLFLPNGKYKILSDFLLTMWDVKLNLDRHIL